MRKGGLLVVASALDLDLPHGCTPSWWFLLKALHAEGWEVTASAYRGKSVASPWWEALPNPLEGTGGAFARLRPWLPRGVRDGGSKLMQGMIRRAAAPAWEACLSRALEAGRGIKAVLYLSAPPAHLGTVAARLKKKYQVPQVYYDGDAPASLPGREGFHSGMMQFQGPELAHYDLVISNSTGCQADYLKLGARRSATLWWGADADFFRPRPAPEPVLDFLFCGHGEEYRREALTDLVYAPSQARPRWKFGLAGSGFNPPPGASMAVTTGLGLSGFGALAASSRVQVCATRSTHAAVTGSSTARIFELASLGHCLVGNAVEGMAGWFEPGRELLVLEPGKPVLPDYARLLRSPALRSEMGRRARKRVLDEHTTGHRARQLTSLLGSL